MNEQIRELAKQANAWYPTGYPSGEGGDAAWQNSVIFEKEDLQKFAELIVQECIRCCEGNSEYKNHTDTEWGKGLASGIGLCKEAMKTHFGVEE